MILYIGLGAFCLALAVLFKVSLPLNKWTASFFSIVLLGSMVLYACFGGWRGLRALDSYDNMLVVLNELYQDVNLSSLKVESALNEIQSNLPDEPFLWFRLGEIYEKLGWMNEAKHSFATSLRLAPTVIDTKIKYAYASSLSNQGFLDDSTTKVVQEILEQQPKNLAAQNLIAMDAYKREDYKKAALVWQGMLKDADKDSFQERNAIERALEQAQSHIPYNGIASSQEIEIEVKVMLPESIDMLKDGQLPVFIFAKDIKQSGPPLAVKKLRLEQLPTTVILSKQDAMRADVTLGKGQDIIVTARIAKSMSPLAASGDLQGHSEIIHISGRHQVNVVVDKLID